MLAVPHTGRSRRDVARPRACELGKRRWDKPIQRHLLDAAAIEAPWYEVVEDGRLWNSEEYTFGRGSCDAVERDCTPEPRQDGCCSATRYSDIFVHDVQWDGAMLAYTPTMHMHLGEPLGNRVGEPRTSTVFAAALETCIGMSRGHFVLQCCESAMRVTVVYGWCRVSRGWRFDAILGMTASVYSFVVVLMLPSLAAHPGSLPCAQMRSSRSAFLR